MKFIERKLIEEKLNKKIGLKRVGWLTNNFDESFESDHTINDVDLGDALNLVEKFLKNKDMRKIVFFPDSSGWEDCSKDDILKPIFFDDIKEPSLLTVTQIDNPGRQKCVEHYDIWYFIPLSKNSFTPDENLLAKEFLQTGWKTVEEARGLIKDTNTLIALAEIKNLFQSCKSSNNRL